MKPYARADRVAGEVQKELADLLIRKLKDPRLGGVLISGVKMTPDLKLANVYFSFSGDENERQKALKGLESATGFIRQELGRRMELRYTPNIRFYYDTSFDYGERIENLIQKLRSDDSEDNSDN